MTTLHDKFSSDILNLPHTAKLVPGEWFLQLACGHTLRIGVNPLNATRWFCPMCFHSHLTAEREAAALRRLIDSR